MRELTKPHPNLSDEINRNIQQSEISGGVWLNAPPAVYGDQRELPVGRGLRITTRHTTYVLRRLATDEFTIEGNVKFCPVAMKCWPHGSTWGGALLKLMFVGRGMHFEFGLEVHGTLTTTVIEDIEELPDGVDAPRQ